jgi:hypothetical protein
MNADRNNPETDISETQTEASRHLRNSNQRTWMPDDYDELASLLERVQGLIGTLDMLRADFGLNKRNPASAAYGAITDAASMFLTEADDMVQRLHTSFRRQSGI